MRHRLICALCLLLALSVLARTEAAHPGAESYAPELQKQLNLALNKKGPDYRARTRHKSAEGVPKFTNRLILETSPYLLQHAHNPVNWYPWGDEAFETARRLGRPILLSIGYSTCHWCHVMEEESFEDLEIAAYLNEHYVAVKVDREERPDIDSIYMTAVQALTGRGGWPMTTWLTPDREVFHGGTYFPPRDGARGGKRPGFLTLLGRLEAVYREQPEGVKKQAKQLSATVKQRLRASSEFAVPELKSIELAMDIYRNRYDEKFAGLKRAPKFPSDLPTRLLLAESKHRGEGDLQKMALDTLRAMSRGGMYDHVGGGFHRYSVDERWLVPHFEKMLYDNAQLVPAYVEAWQVSGEQEFASRVEEILTWVEREMSSPEGGFYSATDADSIGPHGEMEEGYFFTWTLEEIGPLLSEQQAAWFAEFYGLTAGGNFEGRNIPFVKQSVAQFAKANGVTSQEVDRVLAATKERLYAARSGRPAPLRDDKILTSWNGLMLGAFAKAGHALDRPEWISRAEACAEFLTKRMVREGRLLRTYREGRARLNAYLDDYAFTIAGLLDLFEATANPVWIERALQLQKQLDANYAVPGGAYFLTAKDHEQLLAREIPVYDGAEPSGNSIALHNLARLNTLTGQAWLQKRLNEVLAAVGGSLQRSPTGMSDSLSAVSFELRPKREIVLVTGTKADQAKPFVDRLRKEYLPQGVRVVVSGKGPTSAQVAMIPWLKGKVARKGKPTVYVCTDQVCQLPTQSLDTFGKQLSIKAEKR